MASNRFLIPIGDDPESQEFKDNVDQYPTYFKTLGFDVGNPSVWQPLKFDQVVGTVSLVHQPNIAGLNAAANFSKWWSDNISNTLPKQEVAATFAFNPDGKTTRTFYIGDKERRALNAALEAKEKAVLDRQKISKAAEVGVLDVKKAAELPNGGASTNVAGLSASPPVFGVAKSPEHKRVYQPDYTELDSPDQFLKQHCGSTLSALKARLITNQGLSGDIALTKNNSDEHRLEIKTTSPCLFYEQMIKERVDGVTCGLKEDGFHYYINLDGAAAAPRHVYLNTPAPVLLCYTEQLQIIESYLAQCSQEPTSKESKQVLEILDQEKKNLNAKLNEQFNNISQACTDYLTYLQTIEDSAKGSSSFKTVLKGLFKSVDAFNDKKTRANNMVAFLGGLGRDLPVAEKIKQFYEAHFDDIKSLGASRDNFIAKCGKTILSALAIVIGFTVVLAPVSYYGVKMLWKVKGEKASKTIKESTEKALGARRPQK